MVNCSYTSCQWKQINIELPILIFYLAVTSAPRRMNKGGGEGGAPVIQSTPAPVHTVLGKHMAWKSQQSNL